MTKVSKKRQVRRAISRSDWASAAPSGGSTETGAGRLIQRATAGDASQRTTNGAANGQEAGAAQATTAAVPAARTTPPAIWR